MNSCYKIFTYLVTVCIFCSFLLFTISCVNSKSNQFHTKIQRMSNDALLNYYRGINDRINDIGSGIEREKGSDQNEQERIISNMPFLIGGEGYNLDQKRKIVLKELNIRGVSRILLH